MNDTTKNPAETQDAAPAASEVETVAATPRRRGRPSRAESEARAAGAAETGEAKADAPKAARPRSSKKSADAGLDIESLAKQLAGIHVIASMVTQSPELQLSEAESRELAKGVVAVCEQYNLQISGKTGAALQLLGAAAMVYLPRLAAIRARKAQENANRTIDGDSLVSEVPANASATH